MNTKDSFKCPRMQEVPVHMQMNFDAVWRPDRSCSFCGSMNPDDFMSRLEDRSVELEVTTKDYKVYVRTLDASRPTPIKFYFQHLSPEQQRRFVELANEKKLIFSGGIPFTVLPFFIGRRS